MNSLETDSLSHLPLGWARTNTDCSTLNQVKLPFTSQVWIPTADISHQHSFADIYREQLSTLPNGFVLQSCDPALRDYLIEQGCQVVAMGVEAVLDLPWRGKRSVRELARRGRRHGAVKEIKPTITNQRKLAQLIRDTVHGQGPQLRYTARPEFDDSTRCFALETPQQKWLTTITLSKVSPSYAHTELWLRRHDAPVGVMEALISAIAQQLASEGVTQLSLGNVSPPPYSESLDIFTENRHPQEQWVRSQLAFRLGRASKFAFNYEGLWHFKNKFTPRWQPSYLCASPNLSWATLIGLGQVMGYFDLVRYNLQKLATQSFPTFKPQTQATSRRNLGISEI